MTPLRQARGLAPFGELGLDGRLQFQRGRRAAGPSRKIRLRVRHALLIVVLTGLVFVGLQRIYLSALTSPFLDVDTIDVRGATARTEADVRGVVEARLPANLSLLDTARLEAECRKLVWVKSVRIDKRYPSTVRLTVVERTPMAVLKTDTLALVDEEGVVLEDVPPDRTPDLPVLVDDRNFLVDYRDKIRKAAHCLTGLPAGLRSELAVLDLSPLDGLALRLKDHPAWILVGLEDIGERLGYCERKMADWESRFGPLASVNCRLAGRIYLRRLHRPEPGPAAAPGPAKEVL